MNKKRESKILKFPKLTSSIERHIVAILFSASEPLDLETIQSRIKTKTNILKVLVILILSSSFISFLQGSQAKFQKFRSMGPSL